MENLKVEADYSGGHLGAVHVGAAGKADGSVFRAGCGGMRIEFVAFGYKYGILADADLVFDVRCVANPYYVKGLREKLGRIKEVQGLCDGV